MYKKQLTYLNTYFRKNDALSITHSQAIFLNQVLKWRHKIGQAAKLCYGQLKSRLCKICTVMPVHRCFVQKMMIDWSNANRNIVFLKPGWRTALISQRMLRLLHITHRLG